QVSFSSFTFFLQSQQKCIVIFALVCCFAVLVALIFSAVDIWGEDEDGITEDNCSRDCRVVLVENIPEDISFSDNSTPHVPLSVGLYNLLDQAIRNVEIVSPLWLLNSSDYESSFQPAARQGRALLSRLQGLKAKGIHLKISSGMINSTELDTLAKHNAEVHYVNTMALTNGRLLSSFWVVDRKHFYIGSASMDWRSLAIVFPIHHTITYTLTSHFRKELGVLVYNCSCLALDLHRVFSLYWGLQYKDFIPSFWSKRLFALFNRDTPLQLTLNSTKAQAYVSTSPDVLIPKGRSNDLEAISRVIQEARHFIYISIIDYLPLLSRDASRYWSRIDGLIREALILRKVRVRLLISCWEKTHPLTFNFIWSLRSLCMDQANCSLEAKFFNPRVQRDGNVQGINYNRFIVTERAIYLGNLDWVGNEFNFNAGAGLVISQPEGIEERNSTQLLNMAEDDSEWVVESIVGYLGSPEWVIPVTDFMENRCTVFDDEDENKLSYTEIHLQYKKLVEKLLDNYMQEVGINEQQFLDACTSPFAKSKTLQSVFQPVLATDDFQVFRSLMVQKNMELQLQALRVIKERNGALPECLTDGVDVMTELQQQEMKILQEVLKKSKEEYDEEMSRRLLLEEEVGSTSSSGSDKPMAESREAQNTTSAPSQQGSAAKIKAEGKGGKSSSNGHSAPLVNGNTATEPNLVNGKPVRKNEGKTAASGGDGKSAAKSSSASKPASSCGSNGVESTVLPAVRAPGKSGETSVGLSPDTKEKSSSSQTAAEAWLEEAHREAGFSKPYTELSASQQEQLQQRAAYLRQQRDKLHALKKEQQKTKPTTPEEAPATTTTTTPEISAEERKKLQKRKHLADKLKEEVIKK
ncbi:Inactive phospholipase D5, partial [Nibea albiflora]